MDAKKRWPKIKANLSKVVKGASGSGGGGGFKNNMKKHAKQIKEQVGDGSILEYAYDTSNIDLNDENSLVYILKESEQNNSKTLYLSLMHCDAVLSDLKKSCLSKFNSYLVVQPGGEISSSEQTMGGGVESSTGTISVHGKSQKWTPAFKNNWLFRVQNYLYNYERAELTSHTYDLKTLFGFIDSQAELNDLINEFRTKIKDAYYYAAAPVVGNNKSSSSAGRTFAYKFTDQMSATTYCLFGFVHDLNDFVDKSVLPLLRSLEYKCLVRKFERELKFLTLYDEIPKFKIKLDESCQVMTLDHESVYSFGLLNCQRIYESFEREALSSSRSGGRGDGDHRSTPLAIMSIVRGDDQRRVQFGNKQAVSHVWKQELIDTLQSFFVHHVGFLSFDVSEEFGKQLTSRMSQQDSIKYHIRVVWSSSKYLLCAVGLKEWLYEKMAGIVKSSGEIQISPPPSSSRLSVDDQVSAAHEFKPQNLVKVEVKLESIYSQLDTRFSSDQEFATLLRRFYNELVEAQPNSVTLKKYLDIRLEDETGSSLTHVIFEGCQSWIDLFVQYFSKHFAPIDLTCGQTTRLEETVFYLKNKFMEYNILQNFDGKYRTELIELLRQRFPSQFVSLSLFAERYRGFMVRYTAGTSFEPLSEFIFGTYFSRFHHEKITWADVVVARGGGEVMMNPQRHLQQLKSAIVDSAAASSVLVKVFESRGEKKNSKSYALEIIGPHKEVAKAVELVRSHTNSTHVKELMPLMPSSCSIENNKCDQAIMDVEDGEICDVIESTQEEFNLNLVSSKTLLQSSQLSTKFIQTYLKDCFMVYNVLLHFNRVFFHELIDELKKRFPNNFVALTFFKDNTGRGLRLEYVDNPSVIQEYIHSEYMAQFAHKSLTLDEQSANEITNKINFKSVFCKYNKTRCQFDVIGKKADIELLDAQISLLIRSINNKTTACPTTTTTTSREQLVDLNNNNNKDDSVIICPHKFTHQITMPWYQSDILQQIKIGKAVRRMWPSLHLEFDDDRITLASDKEKDIEAGKELLRKALKSIKVAEMSGVNVRERIEWWNAHSDSLKSRIKQMKLNCVVDTKSIDGRVLIYGLQIDAIKKCEVLLNTCYSNRTI